MIDPVIWAIAGALGFAICYSVGVMLGRLLRQEIAVRRRRREPCQGHTWTDDGRPVLTCSLRSMGLVGERVGQCRCVLCGKRCQRHGGGPK